MKKMKRMAALILSCALAAVCPVMGSQAEEDTRKDFVFGDYVGDVDPASGAYAWVGMRIGVMESLFKLDDSMTVQKNLVDDYSVSDDGLVWTIRLRDNVTVSERQSNGCRCGKGLTGTHLFDAEPGGK